MTLLERRWLVLLGGHPSVSGLDLVFVPQRSQIASVEMKDLRTGQSYIGSDRLVSLQFPDTRVDMGFVGMLTVAFTEDAPLIAAIAWESAERPKEKVFSIALPLESFAQAGFVGSKQGPKGTTPEVAFPYFFWLFLMAERARVVPLILPAERGQFFGPYSNVNVFVLRRQAMENDERARRFFLGLDAGTIAKGVPEEWAMAMEHVNGRLAVRVEERGIVGGASRVPEFAQSPRFGRHLMQASMFVQTLIVTHLYEGQDDDMVDWAFSRFALDALFVSHRDPVQHGLLQSHGAPDGIAFFRFAELALACIEHGIHEKFWRRHLGALVHSAHLYAEHGWELVEQSSQGHPPKYVYAYRENRRFPIQRLRYLAQECQAPPRVNELLFFEDHFTSVVAQALNIEGSTPVPTRPLAHPARVERQETGESLARLALAFAESSELYKLLAQ